MDVVAEYAHYYGGTPRPGQSWHEVLALVQRAGMFDARELLRVIDGRLLAEPAGTGQLGQRVMVHEKLRRTAYPGSG